MRRTFSSVIGMLCLAGSISTSHAIMAVTTPVRLAKADREEIERVACVGPHGVRVDRLEALTYSDVKPLEIYVTAYCRSHGHLKEHPMRQVVRCDNSKGKWTCASSALEILVDIANRSVGVRPNDVAPDAAVEIVKSVAASGALKSYLTEHHDLACRVSLDDPARWRVDCDLWQIYVTEWCADGKCSYKVTGVYESMA